MHRIILLGPTNFAHTDQSYCAHDNLLMAATSSTDAVTLEKALPTKRWAIVNV